MSSFSIKEIREGLDAWFSGQTELKRMLSVLGHMQSQKIRSSRLAPDRQIELPRPVLFITGSTGSGKTFCVKNFARCLGLPFKRINASQLSQAGWAGVDLQEEIKDFSDRNKGNEYAEYGVIFIDEVDKLSNRLHSSGGGDVSMAIQTSLLDILEGESIVSDTKLGGVETIKTKNYMVILGGSFEEPRRAVKNSKTIGFHDAEEQSLDTLEWKEFMVKTGILPEIVGRITDVYEMQKLTDEELKDAILNMPDGAYTQYYNMSLLYNRQFVLGEQNLKKIIEKIRTSPYGLREINTQVTRLALDFLAKECENIVVDMDEKQEHTKTIEKQTQG